MIVYCCGVALSHEVGETATRFYHSIEELKKDRICWIQCGIAEIELTVKSVIPPEPTGED